MLEKLQTMPGFTGAPDQADKNIFDKMRDIFD
jgi:hypothetical protein